MQSKPHRHGLIEVTCNALLVLVCIAVSSALEECPAESDSQHVKQKHMLHQAMQLLYMCALLR